MKMKTKIISLLRVANIGFHNFIRNAWLSTSAIAIMVVTLTIIMTSLVVNSALNDTVADIASNITVSVYLKPDVDDAAKNDLLNTLENDENVAEVKYVSQQDALGIFQNRYNDDEKILEAFAQAGSDTLPPSYEVTVKDLSNIDSVVAVANDDRFNDVVDDTSVNETRKESIGKIAKAQDFVNIASIGAAAVFAGISILIIFNTIRMAVFTRSDEIEIMKLIGATPRYIRAPFLFEASLYGVFAGIISTVILYSVLLGLGPSVNSQLLIEPTIEWYTSHFLLVMLAAIIGGLIIGLFSSMFSLSRYLRFKKLVKPL